MRQQVGTSDSVCKSLKHAARELYVWSKCRHPYVLPLIGLVAFRGLIGMVSQWVERGNLRSYLEENPNHDRFRMSADISAGLAYLHECGIVHGDLKGLNILIDNAGNPMLTDFGNAVLQDCTLNFTATTRKTQLSSRWAAPELLDDREGAYSRPADVYALGMTILEAFTGQVPYPDKSEHRVMILVMIQKVPPERPETHIPPGDKRGDALWSLLLRCWANEPGERPNASEVAKTIRGFVDQVSPLALTPYCPLNLPPPHHEQLPNYRVRTPPRPDTPLPLAAVSIPLELPLVVDPASEDASIIQILVHMLTQLDPIGRPVPAPTTASSEYALHDIGARVFEVLVAGGKRVHDFAVHAWANAVGASPACSEVVVAIVAVTRGSPPVLVRRPSDEDLNRVGSDVLRACALLCLGVPGSELVLAKRLKKCRWGENVSEIGLDKSGRRRACEIFSSLATANVLGAAVAVAKLKNPEETSQCLSQMSPCPPVKWPPLVKYHRNLNNRTKPIAMETTKMDSLQRPR
ncbi:hypothetical protein FRC09_007871 [Ceratobasidium sp. 395]|nr:hypothetical protein FRC09_007871 [Ceratobasidium sp. 395]